LQNYLQQSGKKLGILVNFRTPHLRPIRVLQIDPNTTQKEKEIKSKKKYKVYLAGQSNDHDNNWKEIFKDIPECDFHDWEIDSDQTSPDTFFPDDLKGVKSADFMVANPGWEAPSEATWIEVGYFYANNTQKPGDFCNKLIIIWQDKRNPKWSLGFVKKAGHVVATFEEAREKLCELIRSNS